MLVVGFVNKLVILTSESGLFYFNNLGLSKFSDMWYHAFDHFTS